MAWSAYGEEIMADLSVGSLPGLRPWAWWTFELGEEPPDEPALRLAELGLLRDDERARITARAAEGRARIGTPREHHDGNGHSADRDAVALDQAVTAALQARR